MIVVRLVHCRELGYCSRGVRDFFARHSLDWQEFLNDGVPANMLENTGDAIALAVVAHARKATI